MKDKKKHNEHNCLDHMSNEQLVKLLLDLPNKILRHEDLQELSQIILHELCHKNHLGLKKATYMVDNPEFGCMRGVAGYNKGECKMHKKDLWADPHAFSKDMASADFHNKMRSFEHASICKGNKEECQELHKLGKEIGLVDPKVYKWDMRNGNRGVLIFEEDRDECGKCDSSPAVLDKAAALLGLCRLH